MTAHAQWRQREDIIGAATVEIVAHALGRPLRKVQRRVTHRLLKLEVLVGIVRVERLALTELKSVDDQLAVFRGMNLRCAKGHFEGKFLHQLGKHAGVVQGPHKRPLRVVLAFERELQRTARCLRRDDGPQMTELRGVVGVLEVHRRHLLVEPGHHRFGGLAKTFGQFIHHKSGLGRFGFNGRQRLGAHVSSDNGVGTQPQDGPVGTWRGVEGELS
jgi:hypothetical protein